MTIRLHMRALLLGALFALTPAAFAADNPAALERLTVRVVGGGNDTRPADPAIRDIVPSLQDNLRYNAYWLVCRRVVAPVENARVKLDAGLVLELKEVKDRSCSVTVERHGRPFILTRVRLEPGSPVILGGLPDATGAVLFIVLNGE